MLAKRLDDAPHVAVQRTGHGQGKPAFLIHDILELLQILIGSLLRAVYGVERNVEKKRLRVMAVNEGDRLAANGIGQIFRLLHLLKTAINRIARLIDLCSPFPV